MRAVGKEQIKRIVRRLGYDIERRDLSHPARRAAAMQTRGVDLVLDIGANLGQYVDRLRDFGYDGRIVSFEPLPDAFRVLEDAHRHDVAGAVARRQQEHPRRSPSSMCPWDQTSHPFWTYAASCSRSYPGQRSMTS